MPTYDLLAMCEELGKETELLVKNMSGKVMLTQTDDDGNSKVCFTLHSSGEMEYPSLWENGGKGKITFDEFP